MSASAGDQAEASAASLLRSAESVLGVNKAGAAKADKSTIENALANLNKVTANKATARRVAHNKDAIQGLLTTMNNSPKFGKMLEYSVTCFKNMAVDAVTIEEIIEEGVLETFLKIQKLNPFNETLHRMINETIASFCINDDIARMIAERLGGGQFIHSLNKHVEPETVAATCTAMAKIMRHTPNIAMFAENGAIPALNHVASTMTAEPNVMAAAAECLRALTGDAQFVTPVMETQIVPNIIKALAAYPNNRKLVEETLGLIANIAAAHNGHYVDYLRKLGVVDLVVAALEANANNAAILKIGAEALRRIGKDSDVIDALTTRIGMTADLASALARLASLMLVDENIELMIRNEGIAWLINVLRMAAAAPISETSLKILRSGTRALMRICADNTKIHAVMQAGGVHVLMSIIDSHGHDDETLYSVLKALARMITRQQNAAFLVKGGLLEAVSQALKVKDTSRDIAEASSEIYERLTRYPEVHGSLIAAGVVPAILALLKKWENDREIVETLTRALRNLAQSPEGAQALLDNNAAAVLAAILTKWAEDPEIVKNVYDTINNIITNNPNGAALLRDAGLAKAILNSMAVLKDNAAIQKLGAAVVARMTGEDQVRQAISAVWTGAQEIRKNPALGPERAGSLAEKTETLSSFTTVPANLPQLSRGNAPAALVSAVHAALPLGAANSAERQRIIAASTKALAHLMSAGDAAAAATCVQNDLYGPLLAALIRDPSDEDAVEDAMRSAAMCTRRQELIPALVQAGVVPASIQLAKLFPLNEAIQAAAAEVFGAVIADPGAAAQFVASGGASIVMDALRGCMNDPAELIRNLDVLMKLLDDPAAEAALREAGLLDAVIAIYTKHQGNAQVSHKCLEVLTMMVSRAPDGEALVIEMGDKNVMTLQLATMRTHFARAGFVNMDVHLLESLASVHPNQEKLLVPKLSTIPLLQWVTRRFKVEPDTRDTAQRIIDVLEQMHAYLKAQAQKNSIDALLVDESAVPAFLDGLVQGNDPDALADMFDKLEMLLENPDAVKVLAKNGALQAMSALMTKHCDNEQIFKRATNAFQRFCGEFDDDEILTALIDPNVLGAQCQVVMPHDNFKEPIPLVHLQKNLDGMGRLRYDQAATELLTNNGTLKYLSSLATTHGDPLVMAGAAKILGKLSNQDGVADAIAAGFKTIRELIDAIRRNMSNVEFVRCGIYLLGNFAANEELKDEIGIESGVTLIIQALKAHRSEVRLIETATYSLAQLTYGSPGNCAFVMATKGVPLIVSIMNDHVSDGDIMDAAICTLCNLCKDNDTNKLQVANSGGADAIVFAMLNNYENVDVLITACRALSMLAFSPAAVDSIITAGGVQCCVVALTSHTHTPSVVDVAIRSLTTLASHCTAAHMRAMVEEGAVQAIIQSAQSHSANLELATLCTTALCNLSVVHDIADLIIKMGGVEVVITLLNALGFDPAFTEIALRLLFNLTFSFNNLERLCQPGTTAQIVRALKHQSQVANVQLIGLRTIANLCYSDSAAAVVAADGAIELCTAMVRPQGGTSAPAAVQCEVFNTLGSLCRSEENALAMCGEAIAGAVHAITYPPETSVITAASNFLTNLFVHTPTAITASTLVLPGGNRYVPATLTMLQSQARNPEVIIPAVKPLENMAYANQEVRDKMKADQAISVLEYLKQQNETRGDVVSAIQGVIDVINRENFAFNDSDFMAFDRTRKTIEEATKASKERRVPEVVKEVPPKIKNFLTAGALLIKHSRTALPRARHVYMTDDMKWLVWKDPKLKQVDEETRMKIFKIRSVERGRCTEQLQRVRFGKFLANDRCCFSVQGRERSVDLEAADEKECERWVQAIEVLIAHRKALQSLQASAASFE